MNAGPPLFEVSEEGKVKTIDAEGKPIELDLDELPDVLKEDVLEQAENLENLGEKNEDPKAEIEESHEIAADVTPNLEPWILSEEKEKHEVVEMETEDDYI